METRKMQCMLLLYVDEAGWPQLTPAQQEAGLAAYQAYTEALSKAGVLRGVNRLHASPGASTVRLGTNGKPQVLDGPFADSKEQLGGYYVIEVPDVDAAISWAARCPTADHGVVEVRALYDQPDGKA
jgi:hypothetical protein